MTPAPTLLRRITAYLKRYLAFPDDSYATVAALWAIATHCWPIFDAFPYLVITAATKRSGKTRLMELLGFLCANAQAGTALTAATIYRAIQDSKPTLLFDESETLNSEAAGAMRQTLNVGYRRGQTIPRLTSKGIVQFETYCPKCFVLIGAPNDTLRDRAIILTMRRGQPAERFVWAQAEAEGHELRAAISEACRTEVTWHLDQDKGTMAAAVHPKSRVAAAFAGHAGITFLTDRDAEIWLPLFIVAQVLAPELKPATLARYAVDLATLKTQEAASYVDLAGAEQEAQDTEYAEKLLRDLRTVLDGQRYLWTTEALKALQALPTAPWRVFRGTGLTDQNMADLLRRFNLGPKPIRSSGGRKASKVGKGYSRADVEAAIRAHLT